MFDCFSLDFGLDIKDPNVSQAAKALRYLFIHDMRGRMSLIFFNILNLIFIYNVFMFIGLQTKINECLVQVQSLTANPKTDTKLGKVGY